MLELSSGLNEAELKECLTQIRAIAPLEDEAVLEPTIRSLSHLDRAARGVRLHPARRVDRVPPKVVAELGSADDAGDHGP